MNITYQILEDSIPASLTLAGVRKALRSAMGEIRTASEKQVNFFEREQGSARANILFKFARLPIWNVAYWHNLEEGKYTITFNEKLLFSASMWQFWRPFSLRTFAIHEILHVIGLYRRHPNQPDEINEHNDDIGSVMHSNPVFPHITDNDRLLLLTATRKEKLS